MEIAICDFPLPFVGVGVVARLSGFWMFLLPSPCKKIHLSPKVQEFVENLEQSPECQFLHLFPKLHSPRRYKIHSGASFVPSGAVPDLYSGAGGGGV